MKYRLYVSGFCNETRKPESCVGIGGVILNDLGYERIFSKYVGKGTMIEANIQGILYGINHIINEENLSDLTVYSTNIMLINYLNKNNVEIPRNVVELTNNLIKLVENLKFKVNYEYFEVNEYNYVRNLAKEALKI